VLCEETEEMARR
jgi:hypothetical protein